ncbi:hypothetical protein J23TS9_13240 [Paenibacillus sp. J23TS9]|uniref:DUF2269 family protein n=1 Tax=Paenibacillus sp. J23TS9 TaxID=2807193 RepID=UPI001B228BF3|nr:DUF2269 family protein [Paenibacillus sp. J23TS9]GIP26194.1 hypothetical protein J23TS9_13240 [Paenibacillus sp. J23TS9]
MYTYLLFIHILSAITAIVTIMGSPFIMSGVRTTGQAKFGLELQNKLAILPKIGGTLLILSGLGLGFLQTYLFREMWYVVSIAIFFVILIIVAVMLPSGIKKQLVLLQQTQGETLSDTYQQSRRRSAWLEGTANLAVFISIILMVFKPF